MKTITEKKTKSELKNRPEPLSTSSQRQIDFRRRAANRSLETGKLLALLESETPKFFELAEVVGKWVWIQFADKQPVAVTRILAELGFHWNNARHRGSIPAAFIVNKPLALTRARSTVAIWRFRLKSRPNNESDLLQLFSTVREKNGGIRANLVRGKTQ